MYIFDLAKKKYTNFFLKMSGIYFFCLYFDNLNNIYRESIENHLKY